MRKFILVISMALMTIMVSNASNIVFNGTWTVTMNGNTQTSNDGEVVIETNPTGVDNINFVIPPFGISSVSLFSVPGATVNGITVYSAERDVQFGGTMKHAIVLARYIDGMMTAEINIPGENITARFDNVYDHFQLPNSGFEAWTASTGEPDRWHGFKSAGGTYATTSAALVKLEKSQDVRTGATGYSAVMTANSIIGIVANGTMTNGRLMAGAMSASSLSNHAEMDKTSTETDANGDLFYMPLYAKPDVFNVWMKYTQGTANANNKASVSVKTFDGTYYQEPVDMVYTNLSGSIVGGQIPAGDWTHYSFPFDYDSYAANGAASEAIFVTFSTNGNPGQGSKNDALYVDDMQLVYLAQMTDLRYQGTTLQGWNPAVTDYTLVMDSEPNLDDFTADVTGASAVVTKTMEQTENGYRIAISAVSGDLQTATAYVINVTAPAAGMKGDVDNSGAVNIADVTALIDYLLAGGDVNEYNADVDGSGAIDIADVTSLIDFLLTGSFPAN